MLNALFLRRPPPALEGETVFLRMPRPGDYREWARLRGESRAFLTPWEPRWADDELSRRAWRQRLRRYRREFRSETGIAFFVFERAGARLAGGLSVGNIRRGVAQSAQIGYWMGESYAGRGLMRDALGAVVPFCFEELCLHRIEAACIPDNRRSVGLLEKAGFKREGLLKSYLRINGVWRDHYLYALVAEERPVRQTIQQRG